MMRSIGVKFLDVPELSNLEGALRQANESCRDRQVRVKLEAYASSKPKQKPMDPITIKTEPSIEGNVPNMSRTDTDDEEKGEEQSDEDGHHESKRVKLELETPQGFVVIPSSTRSWKGAHPKKNLFKNLVLTLNSAFCDYEFSSVSIEQFKRIAMDAAVNNVNSHFFELSSGANTKLFTKDLWMEIEKVVGNPVIDPLTDEVVNQTMQGVQIYSYFAEDMAEIDADPLSSFGNLWAFNYFFCNPTEGKIVFLACSCRQRKFSQISCDTPEITQQDSFFEAWDEEDDAESEAVDAENNPEGGIVAAF